MNIVQQLNNFFFQNQFGGIVATYLAGWLMKDTNRWDIIFYYIGGITLVWSLLFVCMEIIQFSFFEKCFFKHRFS